MKAAAATVSEGFAHVGQQQAVFEGDFSSHQFEQEDVIYRLERVAVSQSQFKLGCVVFGIDAFDGQSATVGGRHDFVDQTNRVNRWTRTVDVSARGIPFRPATQSIGLHHKRLEFDTDFGGVTLFFPVGDCPPQRMARRDRERFAAKAQITNHHARVRLPTRAHIVHPKLEVTVGQSLEQPCAWGGNHRAVKGEGKGGHAVVCAASRVIYRQVFTPGESVMVGKKCANSFVCFHKLPSKYVVDARETKLAFDWLETFD